MHRYQTAEQRRIDADIDRRAAEQTRAREEDEAARLAEEAERKANNDRLHAARLAAIEAEDKAQKQRTDAARLAEQEAAEQRMKDQAWAAVRLTVTRESFEADWPTIRAAALAEQITGQAANRRAEAERLGYVM